MCSKRAVISSLVNYKTALYLFIIQIIIFSPIFSVVSGWLSLLTCFSIYVGARTHLPRPIWGSFSVAFTSHSERNRSYFCYFVDSGSKLLKLNKIFYSTNFNRRSFISFLFYTWSILENYNFTQFPRYVAYSRRGLWDFSLT
jgi:hypothetical protein